LHLFTPHKDIVARLEVSARPAASPAWRVRVLRVSMLPTLHVPNAVDEAASAGRRRCQPIIELEDFVEAIDRIRLGLDKRDWDAGDEEYPACVPERLSL
jgi:hypothetical protein